MQGAEATPYALRRVVAETMAAAMRVITPRRLRRARLGIVVCGFTRSGGCSSPSRAHYRAPGTAHRTTQPTI